MADDARGMMEKPLVRYGMAAAVVILAYLLRFGMVHGLGLGLPPFLTFYPAVFLVAILGGLGPGLAATALAALFADLLILPPYGQIAIFSTSDAVALVFFMAMGIFSSLVAEHYRRGQRMLAILMVEKGLRENEEELSQAREYRVLALEAAGLGAWECRPATSVVSGNAAWRRIMGFGPGESTDLAAAMDRIHPEDRAMADEAFRRAEGSEDGALAIPEHRLRWPDGSIRWVSTQGRAHMVGEGAERRPERFVGVTLDVTERRSAEEGGALDRAKLDVALESMADAVFICDASGNSVEFNDAFVTFFRFRDRAECMLRHSEYPELLEAIKADGTALPLEDWPVPRALRGESATGVEYQLRRKDRGEAWFANYSYSPVRDTQGAITGAVVVGRDVTERKRAEETLRESELMYRSLFNSMDEGFCLLEVIFDGAGKPVDLEFLELNAAFEKQTGLVGALGKRVCEVAPGIESVWLDTYGGIALTGVPAHVASESKALSRWFEASAYRVGRPEQRHVAVVFSDVTERVKAERHIKQLFRIYSVLSDVNQMIVREKDVQTMLTSACRIAVAKGAFPIAWIGKFDAETRILRPVAWDGEADRFIGDATFDLRDESSANRPTVRCILSGQPVITNDIATDPLYGPWREKSLKNGFHSAASFPLTLDGEVVGTFNLCAGEPGFFVDEELALLEEMAMDMSFALGVGKREDERRAAEARLRQLNRVYSVLSAINETIVREKDSQALLEAACRIAVEKGKFRMAWVGMLDPLTHALKPIASGGDVNGYLELVRIDLQDPEIGLGPGAQCFHTGKHSICNDIENQL